MATRHTITRLSDRIDLLTRRVRPPLRIENLTDDGLVKALANLKRLIEEASLDAAVYDDGVARWSEEEILQYLVDSGALTPSDFQL
jgi:hypothetical protein